MAWPRRGDCGPRDLAVISSCSLSPRSRLSTAASVSGHHRGQRDQSETDSEADNEVALDLSSRELLLYPTSHHHSCDNIPASIPSWITISFLISHYLGFPPHKLQWISIILLVFGLVTPRISHAPQVLQYQYLVKITFL